MKQHHYQVRMDWTGNQGEGTKSYRGYRRDHTFTAEGKPAIQGSSDPAFRGDPSRYSPEDLLVAALSSCHMLWYLHLCADRGVNVSAYSDSASGVMEEGVDGSGAFVRVLLKPKVTISAGSDAVLAKSLHEEAHRFCFIAKSVNFPVEIEPVISTG